MGGRRTHCRVSGGAAPGAGPAVVLVHGLVVSSRYMVPTLEKLAPRHTVYAPDLPGFGRSEGPRRALDVAGLADALAAWMEAAGLGRAVLVGNSVGCQVIADLVARRPGLAEGVVLQGPTMDPPARTVARQVARLLRDAPGEPPSLLPVEALDYLSAGTRRAWRTFRHALEDPIEEKLPRVSVPALVVRGSRDPVCPRRWAEEAAGLLPQGRLVVLPGAPHAANFAAPGAFAREVHAFVEGLRGS